MHYKKYIKVWKWHPGIKDPSTSELISYLQKSHFKPQKYHIFSTLNLKKTHIKLYNFILHLCLKICYVFVAARMAEKVQSKVQTRSTLCDYLFPLNKQIPINWRQVYPYIPLSPYSYTPTGSCSYFLKYFFNIFYIYTNIFWRKG